MDPHKSRSATLKLVLLICNGAKLNILSGDKITQLDGCRTGPACLFGPNLQACRMDTLNLYEEILTLQIAYVPVPKEMEKIGRLT
jgi:hypothetical protein